MSSLTARDLESLVRVMQETAGLPDVDTFRTVLFQCLDRELDLPLVALNLRLNGEVRIAQSRDHSEPDLRARFPSAIQEQSAYLEAPLKPEVMIVSQIVPEPVLGSLATVNELWQPRRIRDGVAATLTGPSGMRGLVTLLTEDRRALGRLRRYLGALAPYLQRSLDHFAHLERVQARLECLEALSRLACPAAILGERGGLECVSPAAQAMFRELTGSPDLPPEVAAWAAKHGLAAPAGRNGLPYLEGEGCTLVRGRWLQLRWKRLAIRGHRYHLLTLEDPAERERLALERRCADLGLTGREREIARLVVQGRLNKEISRSLGICFNTVKNHLHNIFVRTGARNRADFVRQLLDGVPRQ